MLGTAPSLLLLTHLPLIKRRLVALTLGQSPSICATNGSLTSSLLLFQSLNELLNPNAKEFPNGQIPMKRISLLDVLHLGQPRQRTPDLGCSHIHQFSRLRSGLGSALAVARKSRFSCTLLRHVRGVRLLVSKLCMAVGCGQEAFITNPWL